MSKRIILPPRRLGLERAKVFQNLSPQEFGIIEPLTRLIRVETKGALLASDTIGDSVYFIVSGTVCIHRELRDGTRFIVNRIGATEMLGEICALDNQGHSANALAVEPTVLLQMYSKDFNWLEESIPLLARNVKLLLLNRLRFATGLNEALAARRVRCRMARLLTALAIRYASAPADTCVPIPFRLTQSDIADWACVSRQHAEKHLLQLRTEGILQVSQGRRLIILDRNRLLRYCDDRE